MSKYFYGHAEDMLEIVMETEDDLQGQVFTVKLIDFDGKHMIAEKV
jgi:hypothetical protein